MYSRWFALRRVADVCCSSSSSVPRIEAAVEDRAVGGVRHGEPVGHEVQVVDERPVRESGPHVVQEQVVRVHRQPAEREQRHRHHQHLHQLRTMHEYCTNVQVHSKYLLN